ncbi:MAG: hybrid sensor histidine kinase/response regulator [Candidatus Delongbacteria bacterium]|nr:hybrid sensor histidine kinase/response regulator [Candidatus Delongbacteria bacterium]
MEHTPYIPSLTDAPTRIVIVDDDPAVLKSLERILKRDYRIQAFSDPIQAESYILNSEVDLVMSDEMMPNLRGSELIRRIHRHKPDICKIILSGQAEKQDIARAINHGGIFAFLFKPIDSEQLLQTLNNGIENQRMKRQIIHQNQKLQQMNQQLQLANSTKDRFFSIIAHDLRSPFNGLLGLVQFMRESIQELSKEDISQALMELQQHSETVYELLQNLLEWSKMQSDQISYRPAPVELNELIKNIVRLNTVTAEQKGLTFEHRCPESARISTDSNLLNTILRNLVSNAVKFTPFGGSIRLEVTLEPERVIMVVSDTGIGIPEENLSRLFRIDHKFSTPGTAGERGTGLGLILCHELAGILGGELRIESPSGQGTRVSLIVPSS